MNVSTLMHGNHPTAGQAVKAFVLSVALNQIAFDLKNAAFTAQRTDKPVRDAYEDECIREAYGDNGTPQPTKLDANQLATALGYAFHLAKITAETPDPETGRKNERLLRQLDERYKPSHIVQQQVDFVLPVKLARAKADAAALGADPTKRIEAIQTEVKAQYTALLRPVQEVWKAAVLQARTMSEEDLIDEIIDAIVDAKRNPALEVKKAAVAIIDGMKRAFEAGKFASPPAWLWELAGRAPVNAEPETPAPTPEGAAS